jgi:Lon protease-like protein
MTDPDRPGRGPDDEPAASAEARGRGLSDAALADLAVFPLPDLVFFPGTLLPLHIFEPRYRQMTADVLRSPAPVLAVARLRPGWEADYHGTPPIFDVAGVGLVVHHEQLDDGRYNLLLQGLARVRLLAPTLERPYRRVRAELVEDRYPPATDLGVATAALLASCQKLVARVPELGRALRERGLGQREGWTGAIGAGVDPSQLADLLGAAFVRDADERQGLLETADVGERLSRVTEAATALLASLGKTSSAPN